MFLTLSMAVTKLTDSIGITRCAILIDTLLHQLLRRPLLKLCLVV